MISDTSLTIAVIAQGMQAYVHVTGSTILLKSMLQENSEIFFS